MSQKNMRLLAMADPWGLETGGLGACHECQGKVLKALGLGAVTDVYEGAKGVAAAGTAITASMKKGDINAVAKGAKEGLKAATGAYKELTDAFSDAEKFLEFMGGSVEAAPVIGYKASSLPMLGALPLPMWGATEPLFSPATGWTLQGTPIGTTYAAIAAKFTTNSKTMLGMVSDEWFFPTPAWLQFGFKPPEPGGVKGQVWNPFKGQWQGASSPIVNPADIATTKDVALVKQPTATGEARVKLIQKSVNTLGGANPAYGFVVAFANQVAAVKAGNYDVANRGYQAGAAFPGLISTIRVLATPIQYVKTALATNMMFTKGPLTGELLEHVRVGWLKDLKALVKSMPAAKRPSNAGLLAIATKDGTAEGPTVPSPKTPISPATTIGFLAILGFLARRFL